MITLPDSIEISTLRREFEEATLMADAFPKKEEFQVRADTLELMIINLEKRRI